MAKKKIKNETKPLKVKMNPLLRLKTQPIIIGETKMLQDRLDKARLERDSLKQENDSLKKVIQVKIDVKTK